MAQWNNELGNVMTNSVIYDGELKINYEIQNRNLKPNKEQNVQVSDPEKSGQATTMLKKEPMLGNKK